MPKKPLPPIFKALLFAFGALLALSWSSASGQPEQLRLTALDVGQGDAVLIETPSGQRVLVDGGPGPAAAGLKELGEHLPAWDRRLDLIVLTHPHADHLSGLLSVVERYEVGQVAMATAEAGAAATRVWKQWLALLQEKHVPVRIAQAGITWQLDQGTTLAVLYPWAGAPLPEDRNELSVVLQLCQVRSVGAGLPVLRSLGEGGKPAPTSAATVAGAPSCALLTGDLPAEQEVELVAKYGQGLRSQLLKVGHHGSQYSSDPAFLAAVKPTWAVISVGQGNRYGHPHQAALDRLAKAGARIWRTDRQGSGAFCWGGEGIGPCP